MVVQGFPRYVMKFLVQDILKKDTADDESIIVTHILRKTAYLMAVWGFHQSNDGWKQRTGRKSQFSNRLVMRLQKVLQSTSRIPARWTSL
jgi:hypothetical protein